ncbi:hypothetical protein BDY19DRAFT_918960 [Irpex rosettiformis]|uniref:Uncharacterized protein n=1 Tax=Irpex rosettiformis TaxID=378272 RepID=A0ACB8UI97_9APHY|nr:hypothetical protein BDY19DRAFT_918960 [Irpex rosettiformis]
MGTIAPREFLSRLKSLYPLRDALRGSDRVLRNPWYVVTAVAYGSSNRPETVPAVWQDALEDLKRAQTKEQKTGEAAHKEQLLLARRMREGLLKGGLLCGYSRAINSLVSLHEVMPEELRDKQTLRDPNTTMDEYVRNGEKLFHEMYHDTADKVQGLLDEIFPDMGWFSNTVGYGITYGATDVLTQVEISYILVAALIAMDTPRQIGWHLANAQHGGASLEEAQAIRQISIEVAEKAGVQWRSSIPEVNAA